MNVVKMQINWYTTQENNLVYLVMLNIYTLAYTKLIKAYMGLIHMNLKKVVTSGEGGKGR